MKLKCNQENLKFVELRGKLYQCMNEYEDLLSIKEQYDRMEGQLKEKTKATSDEIRYLKNENEKIHTMFIQQLDKYNKASVSCLIVVIPFVCAVLLKVLNSFESAHEFYDEMIQIKSGFDISLAVFMLAMVIIAKLDMFQKKGKTNNFKKAVKEDPFLNSPMVFAVYLMEFLMIVLLNCFSFLGLNRLLLFFVAYLITKYILYYPLYAKADEKEY